MPLFEDDPLKVADLIQHKIAELDEERPKLFDTAQSKAQAIAEYDKALAIASLKLRNGTISQLEGEPVRNLPANLIPIVAKGLCYQECFNKEAEEGCYKAVISNIDAIKAGLNGLQSLNKHLDTLK